MGEHFYLYSSIDDALADYNRWGFCNFDYSGGNVGFPRDCGPYDDPVTDQWNSYKNGDRYGS